MPARPESHQLSKESRVKFEDRIPASWLFREMSDDYSLDGSVEIFDEGGLATGRWFFVQLKATDEPSISKALGVSFPVDTLIYYLSLPIPVLVVLYHRPTQSFYCDWAHARNFNMRTPEQQSTTLRIPDVRKWAAGTPGQIESELRAFRNLRSATLPTPVTVGVRLDLDDSQVSLDEFVLGVNSAAGPVSGLIRFIGSVSLEDGPLVVVSPTEIDVRIAGVDYRAPVDSNPGDRAALYCNVLTAIAIAFVRFGQLDVAGRIGSEVLLQSSFCLDPNALRLIAISLLRSGRVSETIALAEGLVRKGLEGRSAAHIVSALALTMSPSFTNPQREAYETYLRAQIAACGQSGDSAEIAMSRYNLGNFLRSTTQFGAAREMYEAAAEADPTYLDRAYWHGEFAGVLFMLDQFSESAAAYGRAIELGATGVSDVYADALMMSGQYKAARAILEDLSDASPEYHLKAVGLRHIAERLGIEAQVREAESASRLAGSVATGDAQKPLLVIEAALKKDALCPLAWFNLGNCLDQSDTSGRFFAYLMAALCFRGDVEAWCNALFLALLAGRVDLSPLIVSAAYFGNGQLFLDRLAEVLSAQKPDFPRDTFWELVREAIEQQTSDRGPVEVRVGPADRQEVFRLPPVDRG